MKDIIPKHIVEKIAELSLVKNQYAAFDLDNTLLIGDIGEAVFALLVKNKNVKSFGWNDYIDLIKTDRGKAYAKVIEVMDNLELMVVENITHEIIHTDATEIELEEYNIPIPKPNAIMESIVTLLNTSGIEVNVITASNSVSAEIICWEYFGIPASNVFGARVDLSEKKRIKTKFNEVPYGREKVNVLKREFKDKPVFTGGDAIWDRFLLSYTTQKGIRLWTGKESDYKILKDKYYKDLEFHQLLSE
ncbi:MAG: haloacid dehalogenase-like hydrolase [Desulfobacteraceae bacterium]|nr:haloacid dehalogenase-like hydrolase [Desulfobacteraceae bacterium]